MSRTIESDGGLIGTRYPMAASINLCSAILEGCANEPIGGKNEGLPREGGEKLELSRGNVGYVSVASDRRETTA